MRQQRGFSLIEVMIVVAIVSVLTAIAVPNYSNYVRRSHRTEARTGLLEARAWLERAAAAVGHYPNDIPLDYKWQTSSTDTANSKKSYTIAMQLQNNGISYVLTATPKPNSAQVGDACGVYRIDNRGRKGANGFWQDEPGYNPKCWDS